LQSIPLIVVANFRNARAVLDTLFVDLSQFTEKTVPRLRELFTYWLTKARWHQPTVMIFDNIDQLMPPEAEVSEGSLMVRIQYVH
jgi:peroxin-1